ncbi:hypothetical protein FHX81_0444 [Saccharothrix saharensis]|uniref:Helix-turn-helix domain-containing protein n=1 Tax=Saccharothrix saharensis TaxID=571190 RepID=A0A543J5X7_9PSEU|nr:helix-turn-helix domain-containing protein [Saccharothrix saharensis]TQM78188.1 hypothetical protein FHX81_0444 [Saccharothrix saharensis]
MTTPAKGTRVTGTARKDLSARLKEQYGKGASIRTLAESIDRSYGFVRRILLGAGVRLRGRGGAREQQKG